MFSTFIRLRKTFLLPVRWKRARKKKASVIVYPPKLELIELKEELQLKIPEAESQNNYKKSYKLQGKLELLDWIIDYGNSRE